MWWHQGNTSLREPSGDEEAPPKGKRKEPTLNATCQVPDATMHGGQSLDTGARPGGSASPSHSSNLAVPHFPPL